VTPPELRDLLADSLALWGVAGRVRTRDEGVEVEVPGAPVLRVVPAAPGMRPIRWWVEREGAGRRRPCGSVLGLLRTLRNALGVPGAAPGRLRMGAPAAP
jgi:hypothetical protein